MKVLKIFLLLFVTGFMFKNAVAQTNASLNIVSANAGVVHQGATLDLTVSVTNTGVNAISAQRVRVQISVPSAVGLPLATGSQNALSSNWIVTSNTAGGVITICNNTDAIPAGATRTSIVKISANTIGSGGINAGLAFGNGVSCTAFGSLTGDNTGDNSSSTPMVVIASQPCTLAASAAAGSITCFGGTTTITTTLTGRSTYTTDGGLTNPSFSAEFSLNGGAFQSSNVFTVNGSASPYTVSVREQGTVCTATAAAVTVNAPTAIVASATNTNNTSNSSPNGTATVTASGGTGTLTYLWSPGGQTTATATGLTAGTYTVTVTDANGCTQTASTTVATVLPCTIAVTASAGTIACFNGTTTLTATATGANGAVEYSLNGGAYQSGNIFTVSAGSYTVTAREVATTSCNATSSSVTITQPTALVAAAATTTILCNGGSSTVTVTATGGTAPYTGTGTFTVNAGAYSYTVTDANGCTSVASGTITQPTALVAAAATTTILCNGGSSTVTVTATGGTAPYTGTGTFTVTAGAYSYTVTDANGCTSVASGTITQPTALVASSSSTTILCNGGSSTVTVTATGGTAPYTGTGTFTRTAGAYSYTVTDANGCTSVASGTITQPTALVAAAATTAILCNGGSSTVTVTATGGTAPYTGTGTFTVTAGAYSYTVTDANGCTSVASGTITQPNAIVVSATAPLITVFGGTTTVTVSATGGTGSYTGTGTFVRSAGTYTFTVTDANGCTGSQTITIAAFTTPTDADPAVGQMFFTNTSDVLQSANTLLFPPVYKLKVPFYNLNQTNIIPNGSIEVKVNLGSKLNLDPAFALATAPLSAYFAWTSAVVVDSVIITGTQIAAIPADFDAVLVFNVKGKLSCTSNVTSRILIVNSGAPVNDEDLQNNNAVLQYTLPVTLTTTQVNVTCNGLNNGIINVVASPGTVVVIRNSANAIVGNTNLAPGTYSITATATGDAPLSNVCSSTTSVTIVQPLVLSATNNTGATVNNLCVGGNNGALTVVSSGGTAPYNYTIAGPTVNTTGASTGTFTNLLAGSYIVTSTDANGCTASTASIIIAQPTGSAPDVSLGSDVSGTLFAASGTSRTIIYNVTEIAGIPAVGDTIRITNPSGFTINFNSSLASSTFGGTTYLLDNSRWKIDNSNPAFTSIILTDPSNAANPGTLLCNQRLNVSVTLTRNTTNISTFTLSAVTRRANGETNLLNNRASIIFTAE